MDVIAFQYQLPSIDHTMDELEDLASPVSRILRCELRLLTWLVYCKLSWEYVRRGTAFEGI